MFRCIARNGYGAFSIRGVNSLNEQVLQFIGAGSDRGYLYERSYR